MQFAGEMPYSRDIFDMGAVKSPQTKGSCLPANARTPSKGESYIKYRALFF
jgi:hypothetical protein